MIYLLKRVLKTQFLQYLVDKRIEPFPSGSGFFVRFYKIGYIKIQIEKNSWRDYFETQNDKRVWQCDL